MRVLVTGTAGFIGFHLARRLLADGHEVVGVDALTDYYDVGLKQARRALLLPHPAYQDHVVRLEDADRLLALAEAAAPTAIVHLAAQAGVRHSLKDPRAYLDANLVGTFNLLEAARRLSVGHLLFASSSSVYDADEQTPFVEASRTDHPLSFYAATKKAGEGMLHAYSHLWSLPTTIARFFTVYGPWGRPDMAPSLFVDAMLNDRPITIYGHGEMERDFTYVDDLVEGLVRLLALPPERGRPLAGGFDSLSPVAPCRVVNVGRGQPVPLMDFIAALEAALGVRARGDLQPIQPGESRVTFASADLLEALTDYRPDTPLSVGVAAFCDWYKGYHGRP
jgi:UDP-glucuronate 4-epimerase